MLAWVLLICRVYFRLSATNPKGFYLSIRMFPEGALRIKEGEASV